MLINIVGGLVISCILIISGIFLAAGALIIFSVIKELWSKINE